MLFSTIFFIVLAGFYFGLPLLRPTTVPTIKVVANHEKPATVVNKEYVGAEACKACHQAEYEAWRISHHALAMQVANEQTVFGDFKDVKFQYHGIESTFYKRDGRFMVRTDGPDGQLGDFPISYTFGVTPLQQYLIEFPGGRYQALSIAWDSRSQAEGGQRWFHLYPSEPVDHKDQLHWTGRYQNWNMQCAECHSTNLKKGYDAHSDSYKTTFDEINVACEACHGPASQHVAWAKQGQSSITEKDKGLILSLQSQSQASWQFVDAHAKTAHLDQVANESAMNACWSCHARRLALIEGRMPGLPLEDTHRPALLTQPTYYADGQQRDEDYTWGSFRQSKMFQNGVTCMHCHEPHALKLRAEGNALCTRCHKAEVFDTENHHFHPPHSRGALCMDCHAPEQNYMVIDGRHDHSFRLPRPDLSVSLGSPNACTQCHQKRKPAWAASAMDKWYGKGWRDRPHYGTVLHEGATQGFKALPTLVDLAQDLSKPALVRATAVDLAKPLMNPELFTVARQFLLDADPSVRTTALEWMESVDADNRLLVASPLLSDPVRGVRIEAARLLADIPDSQLSVKQIEARVIANREYLDFLELNADWPAENVSRGNFLIRQGQMEAAMGAYQRALQLDPLFAAAYVNLADTCRQLQRDSEGEAYLRQGLVLLPKSADLHHALGLLLVRKGERLSALTELAEARQLALENARYSYVYAIALHSAGKPAQALAILEEADRRNPFDMDILNALVSIHLERDDRKAALVYAKKAAEAMPGNAEISQLVADLAGGRQK